jgi:hypothetical protein
MTAKTGGQRTEIRGRRSAKTRWQMADDRGQQEQEKETKIVKNVEIVEIVQFVQFVDIRQIIE